MSRLSAAVVAMLGAAGCAAEMEYVAPGPVRVTMAPPPLRSEVTIGCGPGAVFVPGHWVWRGNHWAWRPGHCRRARPGFYWVAPRYQGGVYYRGYWGRGAMPPSPVPPPAPAY